jgi:predicted small secreted protein
MIKIYGGIEMRMPIAILLIITLTACNTIAGLGTDITNSADWAKEKLGGQSVDLGSSSAGTLNK